MRRVQKVKPNEVQQLHLQLLRHCRFNEFYGERIADDLVDHPDLWDAAMVCRLESLIALRDIPYNQNNSDTLYIIAARGKATALKALAKKWSADCVNFLSDEETMKLLGTSEHLKVLECWWD